MCSYIPIACPPVRRHASPLPAQNQLLALTRLPLDQPIPAAGIPSPATGGAQLTASSTSRHLHSQHHSRRSRAPLVCELCLIPFLDELAFVSSQTTAQERAARAGVLFAIPYNSFSIRNYIGHLLLRQPCPPSPLSLRAHPSPCPRWASPVSLPAAAAADQVSRSQQLLHQQLPPMGLPMLLKALHSLHCLLLRIPSRPVSTSQTPPSPLPRLELCSRWQILFHPTASSQRCSAYNPSLYFRHVVIIANVTDLIVVSLLCAYGSVPVISVYY